MVLSNSLAEGLCPHLPKGDGPRDDLDDLLGPALPYEWTIPPLKGLGLVQDLHRHLPIP